MAESKETVIRVFKDGNQWCAMIGDNLQIGVCGFGDVPLVALCNLAIETMNINYDWGFEELLDRTP